MATHSSRATRALVKLVEYDPAFGSLALWCAHVDAGPDREIVLLKAGEGSVEVFPDPPEQAPAWTDGQTIFYAKGFEAFTLAEQMAVCAHEVLHIAFRHTARAKALETRLGPQYSHRLFNVAADALVNESLRQAKYTLPEPCVSLAVLLAEVLELDMSVTQALAEFDVERLYFALLAAIEASAPRHAYEAALWLRIAPDLDQRNPSSEASGNLEDVQWQQRLARVFSAGGLSGHGVGQLVGRIGDVPKSSTPWEKVLRGLVTRAVTIKPVVAYARPARRWLALEADARQQARPQPAYEPGIARAGVGIPRVAVCLDVSGSISKSLITRFGGEIAAIARRTGAEIWVIVFDDGIQCIKQLDPVEFMDELVSLEFKCAGGTSFVEPIAEAVALKPSVIVVLTDLAGPHGPAPGNVPVVWACHGRYGPHPPFGRVISLNS